MKLTSAAAAFLTAALFAAAPLAAQTEAAAESTMSQQTGPADNGRTSANQTGTEPGKNAPAAKPRGSFLLRTSFFFDLQPLVTVNTHSSTSSAPSPVTFSAAAGARFPKDTLISFAPRVSFYMNYYLWNENAALPAEVENRTAVVPALLLDLPAEFTLSKGRSTFSAGIGAAVLIRAALLANGVSSSDANRDDSSRTAADDIASINSYFWSSARWLYPELSLAWLYTLDSGWKAGFSSHFYLPIGTLIADGSMTGTIVSIAAHFVIPE